MQRFQAITLPNGKYGVIDTANNDRRVGFSFSPNVLYRNEEWGNPIAAEGFATRLSVICERAAAAP